MRTFGLAANALWASSVHLKGGPGAEPTFTDAGLTLSSTGDLTGLGNGDVLVTLTARANPTAKCCTPGGSCKVPGQNPAPIDVSGSESIPASEVKNGNLTLVGVVATESDKNQAGIVANGIPGVFSVTNNLVVER